MDTLFLTKPLMHGPAVKRLQEMGDLLGFDYGDNDGVFGPTTERVVKDTQKKLGLKVDGVCGPVTWATIIKAIDTLHPPTQGSIVDRRGQHPRPKLYGGQRKWPDIVGVTLHQTGCAMPESDTGWDRLNAHIGVTSKGKVIIVNDPQDFIWHAQRLSKKTVGVEIAGNFAGVEGNNKTVWKGGGGPHHVTPEIMLGVKTLFEWLKNEFNKHERAWVEVHPHRQSSRDRPGDPGSAIWQQVGIPWLQDIQSPAGDGGPLWSVGTGRPIPKDWNPNYPAKY